MQFQDWEPVIIKGNKKEKDKDKEKKPFNPPGTKIFNKLDSEDIVSIENVNIQNSKEILQKRNLSGITQKELAQKLNLPVSIISQYESGAAPKHKGLHNKIIKLLDNIIKTKS